MRRPAARVRGGVAARQFWGRSEALVEGCLVARGRVVRFEDGRVALEIQQHEFRTARSGKGVVGATPVAVG